MAIGYRTYKTLGLSVVVWDGDITGDEAEDHVRRRKADPDWPPGPLHLVDTTTVISAPIVANTKLVDMLVESAEATPIQMALIAAGAAFEQATKFQVAATAAGVSELIVFNDVTGACHWLDIDVAATRATLADLRRALRTEGPVDTRPNVQR